MGVLLLPPVVALVHFVSIARRTISAVSAISALEVDTDGSACHAPRP